MPKYMDDRRQPPAEFRAKARQERTIDELLGICKGIIADGQVCEQEAAFLVTWLNENACMACDKWPMTVLLERINRMMSDGVIDAEERAELFGVLSGIAGGKPVAERVASFSSTLPFDEPECITFSEMTFCFTGNFAFGRRADCEREVLSRGGIVVPGIKKNLNYLVVGLMGSRDWLHSTYGTKMEKAIEYRGRYGVQIIGEDLWARFLG